MWIPVSEKYILLNINRDVGQAYILIQRREFGRNRCFEIKHKVRDNKKCFPEISVAKEAGTRANFLYAEYTQPLKS